MSSTKHTKTPLILSSRQLWLFSNNCIIM